MGRYFLVSLICSAVATACAASSRSDSLLVELADDLRRARASGDIAPSFARCPSDTSSLQGRPRSEILNRLGTPNWCVRDVVIEMDCSHAPKIVYFITGKKRDDLSFGGGFPELEFLFGEDGTVTQVDCQYSE